MDIDRLNQAIGEELRIVRLRKKLSRATMAELSGVGARTIQRIENGERPADINQMAALCAVLDQPIVSLMSRAVERAEQ
ncbi:helix-turn-helix domain-containing protein [Rhodococcus hoagii]|uniref:helix-turn-helix domain-containing protein n=1 Tax=Rhodococcus hoagii TaxID=43767 RepID=UPI0019805AA8|nr:helix-turn-helix transcriptional regulator [Prescottella equi]MBM4548509.1 helix-turn-helix domain-containing protein [Prescottella equi]MBM4549559.1 helix-turn-helix domain-containing protein [Prescottella equi]MBM4710876.1 helix-turn-helix domain-containing protein [Prescottella equi]NKT26339.1 helix-turn-helix domain-containing protein [Prescottella equi]NKT29927.1 helix-turn-helix domain-containing protein [Prescottella equi]